MNDVYNLIGYQLHKQKSTLQKTTHKTKHFTNQKTDNKTVSAAIILKMTKLFHCIKK